MQGRYKAIPVDQGAGGEYFPTVANYIHLNPARTKIFDLKKERLLDYRWSSLPLYLDQARRPSWLVVDRVLGALGVEDDTAGRSWYRKYLQKRVIEIALSDDPQAVDATWEKLRRGWYFGSDGFRRELMERLDESLAGKRSSSFSGAAVRAHNEVEAERLIEWGLLRLRVTHEDLESMRKGTPEKMALAWLVKKRTVVKNEWISKQLFCGHPANIPGYVRTVDAAEEGLLIKFRKILESED